MRPRIPPAERFGGLQELREETKRRTDDLERTDGSQFARALDTIQALVSGLAAQVQGYITAYSMLRAEITGIAWFPVLWPAKGGTGSTNAALNTFTSGGPWNAIYAKTATGEMGHAPSNRHYKRDIKDAWPAERTGITTYLSMLDVGPIRALDFPVQTFRYIEDVNQRGDEAIWQYGFIAEDLSDAGLGFLRQEDYEGNLIGIAYEKLPLAHHEALRQHRSELFDLRWRTGELETLAAAQAAQIQALTERLTALEEGGRSGPSE